MAFGINAFAQSAFSSLVNNNSSPILTGIPLAMQEGTPTVTADANVNVTGIALAMQEGNASVIGSAVVDLTGIGFAATLGTANVVIWTQVPTGPVQIYTEVNTGSAPTAGYYPVS